MFATLGRWIIKLTGYIPQLLFLKQRTYYLNRRTQGRRIRGAALVVSNHTSMWDYVTLLFLFFPRKFHMLAAEVLYRSLPMRVLLKCLACVRVDRKSGDMSFLSPAVELLRKGRLVGIFPESRLIENGKMQEFKPSMAYIALKSGAPIIPIYQQGHYGLFRRARVAVGEKLYLRDYCTEEDPSYETLRRLSALVRTKVEELRAFMDACDRTKVDRRISFRWFPYDLLRVSIWPAFEMSFLPRYHYPDGCPHTRRIHGGAIVIANHRSFLDPLVVAHTFAARRVYFLAAEVLYKQNIMLRWFMYLIGAIPVDRNADMDIASFNRTVAVLRAGGVLGVFPEGRISETGALLPFKSGTALMAAMAGKPIIPLYSLRAPHKFARTHVIIGRAVDTTAYLPNGQITARALDELTEKLQMEMLALKTELDKQLSHNNATKHTLEVPV